MIYAVAVALADAHAFTTITERMIRSRWATKNWRSTTHFIIKDAFLPIFISNKYVQRALSVCFRFYAASCHPLGSHSQLFELNVFAVCFSLRFLAFLLFSVWLMDVLLNAIVMIISISFSPSWHRCIFQKYCFFSVRNANFQLYSYINNWCT